MPRRVAALALGLLAAGCADEAPGGGARRAAEAAEAAAAAVTAADPYAGPIGTWPAAWALLIYAANDVADRELAAAFDHDAEEWRRSLGGSALFRVLVQRDYAWFQEARGARAAGPRRATRSTGSRSSTPRPRSRTSTRPAPAARWSSGRRTARIRRRSRNSW